MAGEKIFVSPLITRMEEHFAREIHEKTRNEKSLSSFSRSFAYFAGKLIFCYAVDMAKPKFITDQSEIEKLAPMILAPIKRQVFVCTGKSCAAVGGLEVMAEFDRILREKNLRQGKESKGRNPMGEVLLTTCGSIGFCSIGTAVMVHPDGTLYAQVQPSDVAEIIEEHVEKGSVVKRLALIELGK